MALNLKTPGVYIEEVSILPPSVAPVETAVPAFIGYTSLPTTSPYHRKPTKVNSFLEFKNIFGGPPAQANDYFEINIEDSIALKDPSAGTGEGNKELLSRKISAKGKSGAQPSSHILYYAVQHYFNNNGGPCYIISIDPYGALDAGDFTAGLTALEDEDEPTLIVMPELAFIGSAANYSSVAKTALDQAAKLQDRFVILDVMQSATPGEPDIDAFQGVGPNALPTLGDNTLYGAAYYPYLDTTIDFDFESAEAELEITTHLQKITNADPGDPTEVDGPLKDEKMSDLKTSDNLIYEQAKAAFNNISLRLPPSAAIAGIYSQIDNTRGVWKAPANASVGDVVQPAVKINDTLQAKMNVHPGGGRSVNAIRTLAGRGIVVWGARTLDGNSNEWRYINVRRFFNFVEESVKKATFRFVFEPNDANTWIKIRGMIEAFLTLQWSQGALQGAKPEQAFFVKVGLGQTMTADDILNGRLIVEIGMAVVRPAEFIILRFMHKLPEA